MRHKTEHTVHSAAQTASRVSAVTITGNLLLTAAKLLAGLLGHSAAMVSDAVHSASDVISTVVVWIGVKLSGRPEDANHPYGHERLECVAAVLLSAMLAATGIGIGFKGIQTLFSGGEGLQTPGVVALAAAAVSILVKEAMYRYTARHAKAIHSSAMMADAWHHRSDALSSVGSLIGILGARMGFALLDPLAGVVICAFILKAAFSICADALRRLTDTACDPETQAEVRNAVLEQSGVLGIDSMKTRLSGSVIYVDLEIRADGSQTLRQAHDTAQHVHDAVKALNPEIKECMVHVNPA